jgi:hypothetical protein
MKTKLLDVIVGLILFGQLPAYAATTTYQYDGAPYIFSTDPTLGTHMTGSVTFNFDTTGVTGGPFDLSSVTNIELDAGTYQLPSHDVFTGNFFLHNGAITSWTVQAEGISGQTFVSLLSFHATVGNPDQAQAIGVAVSNTPGGLVARYTHTHPTAICPPALRHRPRRVGSARLAQEAEERRTRSLIKTPNRISERPSRDGLSF